MKSVSFIALFLSIVLISGTFSFPAFADVISPKQQMKLDFTAEQVICAEGLVKIIKDSTGMPSCVKPTTAEKLSQNGWAEQLSEKTITEIKEKKSSNDKSVGTIKKIITLKQTGKNVKAGTVGYAYIFDACAGSKAIKTPTIFVTSDSETKRVKLGSMLNPDSCYTSSAIIKAADPNSITATMLNKGGISDKIESLEDQIADLKSKISAAKQKIPKSDEQTPNPENLNNITSLKKDLKNLQGQLQRFMMALYVPPNLKASEIDIPKSITGKPLEGMNAELISVTESVVKPESDNEDLKRFNVVFEACTGKESVRLPIIAVFSDSDQINVKLINRIIPNSCQVGITKVNAIDSESIIIQASDNSAISKQITNLEKQINELQTKLDTERSTLNELVSKKLDSAGEELTAQKITTISQLRADLLESRTKLYGLMLSIQ